MRCLEVELSARDLAAAIDGLARMGFGIVTIFPADDPATALLEGHGVRLRVVRGEDLPAVLRVPSAGSPGEQRPRSVTFGGIRIELVADELPAFTPPPLGPVPAEAVVTRASADSFKVGRAGMQYRDLVPNRLGGRFIASHIRIPDGGPVPDYVHFHEVRFQMIFCYRGWVRLVYEDQGEPFVMSAGEAVLQPPRIRHRVLEASPGLEVIEIGGPSVHATHRDPELTLPTAKVLPERTFDGQRFVWHRRRAAETPFLPGPFGLAAATGGLAEAWIVDGGDGQREEHEAELFFGFVLDGGGHLTCGGLQSELGAGDAFVIPARSPWELRPAPTLQWLQVTVNH
jgi:mannose-6-phosphate isomerase-like protein (cupin superfamily)